MKTLSYLFAALFCLQLSAAQFKYNELMIKDYDEMFQLVNAQLKKARAVGEDDQEAIEILRETVKLILSRPDSDNMVAKLMPEVRKELLGFNAFDDVLSSLAGETIAVAKDEKAANQAQATSLFVLENLLSQIRPEVSTNPELRRIAERIKSAKIEVSTGVKKDMKLRGMFKPKSPSELAEDILKKAPVVKAAPAAKKDKKAKAEDEE